MRTLGSKIYSRLPIDRPENFLLSKPGRWTIQLRKDVLHVPSRVLKPVSFVCYAKQDGGVEGWVRMSRVSPGV